jgi:hypothetical protein
LSPPPERLKAAPANDAAEASPSSDVGVELRLAIGKHGLGIELARPAKLGCMTVRDLATALPATRFPIDVSGGVSRFRHRRGQLQSIALEIGARELEAWAAPKLRGLVGTRAPEVWAVVRRGGATIAISEADADPSSTASPRALVFDLAIVVEGDDLIVAIHRAR